MNTEQNCEQCLYFLETIKEVPNNPPSIFKQCRRYPPQVLALPMSQAPNIAQPGPQQIRVAPMSTYPSVDPSDNGCGEFIPNSNGR